MRGDKNNFFLIFILIAVVFLSVISFVSSNSAGCCVGSGCYTLVTGNVYYAENNQPAEGAEVTVTCEDSNHVVRSSTETTESSSNGNYYVVFCSTECDEHDSITVRATDGDGLRGENTGSVEDEGYIDVALVNVPLVPEFGMIAGAITILGALGTFFIVRRR